jgi:hypothetical protein
MRHINEFFSPPSANATLYHYTSIAALLGMVETHKLWASHAYYLSDSREITHACDVLTDMLSKDVTNHSGAKRDFVAEFAQWMGTFQGTPYHIYIFRSQKNLAY